VNADQLLRRGPLGTPGKCACGCGDEAPAGSAYAHLDRCRQRAYRERVKAEAKAAGIDSPGSLRAIRGSRTTSARNGDAQRRPRKPREGISIYLPTPLLAERVQEVLGYAIENEGQGDLRPALDAVLKARRRRASRRRG
jgi:hypothetical protein